MPIVSNFFHRLIATYRWFIILYIILTTNFRYTLLRYRISIQISLYIEVYTFRLWENDSCWRCPTLYFVLPSHQKNTIKISLCLMNLLVSSSSPSFVASNEWAITKRPIIIFQLGYPLEAVFKKNLTGLKKNYLLMGCPKFGADPL